MVNYATFTYSGNSINGYAPGGIGDNYTIKIPSSTGINPITSISNLNTDKTSLLLDFSEASALQTIDEAAFYYCGGITNINFLGAGALQTIGIDAFSNCIGITSLNFLGASSLQIIEETAFLFCIGITSLDFSGASALQTIGIQAFGLCSAITNIDFSGASALQTIEQGAFYNCSSITSLDFSGASALQTIGEGAFSNCSQISGNINLSNIINLGSFAFFNCSAINSIILNPNLTSLNSTSIFENCLQLSGDLDLQNITEIGDSVFKNCTNISLTFSNTLTSVYASAIQGVNKVSLLSELNEFLDVKFIISAGYEIFATNLPPGITLEFDGMDYYISGNFTYSGIYNTEFTISEIPMGEMGLFAAPIIIPIVFDILNTSICLLPDCDILLSNLSTKNITTLTVHDSILGYFSRTPQKIKKILKHAHKTESLEETNKPYLIKKNAFGDNIPDKNIHLSGHHRIILKENEKQYFGVQTFKIKNCVKEEKNQSTIIYYHILLEDKNEGIIVNNLPVESCQND